MSIYLNLLGALLLVTLLAGLVQVIRGPTIADRMLAAQLFGTTGVTLLMILAISQAQTALLNAALALALLAPLTLVAFIKLTSKRS